MNNSILNDIKKLLGIAPDYTQFDADLIMHINTAIAILRQLGIGPVDGYSIMSASDTWSSLLTEQPALLHEVKTWMGLKVRLIFDPPLNATVINSMEKQINELEWRISIVLNC